MSKKALRFLADESMEYSLILHLRKQGYDTTSISEESASARDEDILAKAYLEDRVILTNDKDYGDLVFLNNLPHKGVVLFRLKSEKVQDKIKACDALFRDYMDKLKGNFTVVEEGRVRVRS